jgi:2-polyprenyl-6-methoxyphenol hydroxylase-like FAD-dependent oxidoreductase
VVEAKRTGLYDDLAHASTHHLPYHVEYGEGIDPSEADAARLDLTNFLPGVPGPLAIGHPQACQALFDATTAAGATTIRDVSAFEIKPGPSLEVRYTCGGHDITARCRLIVGADGRNSTVRRQAGIELHQDPTHHFFAGMLIDDLDGWPEDLETMGTEGDVQFFVFPQGGRRARLYLSYGLDQKSRFAGDGAEQRFLDAFRLSTLPRHESIVGARIAGPCNSIPNQSTWVESPVAPGVVLIGDAAGYNDPIIGQGLSIALRDVRLVSEALVGNETWDAAAFQTYAEERAERMRRLRFAAALDSVVHAEFGAEAMARKLRFRERNLADPAFGMARAGVMIGPELLPPDAFSDAEWGRLMAV